MINYSVFLLLFKWMKDEVYKCCAVEVSGKTTLLKWSNLNDSVM